METVSIKFEEDFLQDIENAMKKHKYTTKTEFIREAVRNLLGDLEKREYMMKALKFYGSGKGKITPKNIHQAREKAAQEIAQELGISLE